MNRKRVSLENENLLSVRCWTFQFQIKKLHDATFEISISKSSIVPCSCALCSKHFLPILIQNILFRFYCDAMKNANERDALLKLALAAVQWQEGSLPFIVRLRTRCSTHLPSMQYVSKSVTVVPTEFF